MKEKRAHNKLKKMNFRKGIIKINQDFAFSSFMMRGKAANTIFFPGCAFMKMGDELIYKVLSFIKKKDASASVCSLCCSRPSQVLGDKYYSTQKNKIVEFLKERNVKTIYTACPNCQYTLNEIKNEFNLEIDIIMIYNLLNEYIDDISSKYSIKEKVVLHDPCIIRNDEKTQQSVRTLLDKINQDYVETQHNKKDTICCGNIKMLNVLDPKKSSKILSGRLSELKNNADIICSYCSGCLNSFEKAGARVIHILELLFGKVEKKNL